MEYTVVVYDAEEGGYWTRVPSLPGCGSQGETVEEALTNTREAIQSHVIALREDGQEIPVEKSPIFSRVQVAA